MENIKNKEITSRDDDFAKWYTDIVSKAELIDYSSVKGCMIIRPYGYAIWENMQKILDKKFKEVDHENVYMPLFIPESLLNVEKEHVEGFAPEVAWVTKGGNEELTEKLCIRPTSETLFCEHYKNIIKSYRDLPKLYNQWCNVVRGEKTTRPFLRSREFLWQEGHTAHINEEEARKETLQMLNIYANFFESILAIPVIKGEKTEKEKFAGAVNTYTIESMMYNGVALQGGTSHYFGTNFSKAFGITYLDKENNLNLVHQTSWGVSTRMIAALIMTHSDDNGLILPPNIAPIKVVIIPIGNDEKVLKKSKELKQQLEDLNISVKLDDSNKTPGFKYHDNEMKGIPIRIELGPKDLSNNSCILVRRDTLEKVTCQLDSLKKEIETLLLDIQDNLFNKALLRRDSMIYRVKNKEELKDFTLNKAGFAKGLWCGKRSCEEKIKEEFGLSSRCIPLEDNEELTGKCIYCGCDAKEDLYWGKQY
ncbi:MAG: proline--tRNA ligase [Bacilli bacterium]